ncbi:N-6 DNA methylase [Patescibacteria group bacterium]|nr:N-6 DNA methylase [Patescibacteria group bacterium]
MNIALEKLRQNILKIKDRATERSYYKEISNFIIEFAVTEKHKNFSATPEESSTVIKREIGFPDITVRQNERLVGWIEVKLPQDNLNSDKFLSQFKKYKDSLENILFTNLREWQLWQWDSNGKPIKEGELLFDVTDYSIGEEEKLKNILVKFFEGRPYEARTPKQLALALAKKTKLLSQQVEEALEESNEDSDLARLKTTFEKTLIQNIKPHQFANMVAETVAYSLFLASLEHFNRSNGDELNLTTAIDYLPTNIPILADLYSLVNKVSKTIPNIYKATENMIDQLNAADIGKIHAKLVEHKPGEDPVIQFYEPFLKEYDPKEREARGVYYTPKPVVDYIVRSVDYLLRTKFNKPKGLADESVHLLDPATGTGTFLMSAIQEINSNIIKENETLGDEMAQKEFNNIVINHILKHFYGFELLVAPYAIAHLKLTLLLENLGFNFEMTKNDGDTDNDRLKVYLANTLDDPDKPPQKFFGFDSIPQETEHAREIKKNAPILAIVGNPPYSGISQNPVETIVFENIKNGKTKKKKIKTWIGDLIEDYKYTEGDRNNGKHFKEKKHWLGDDYVKFIRFGQWKIDHNGDGVLALITNHSYLDNPTFRGMRWQLMNSFDEIYVLNLHGNSKTEKTNINGEKDENVFSIQQGVAISIFIKKSMVNTNKSRVFYFDLWGLRNKKFSFLLDNSFSDTEWKEIKPISPYYFFVPKSGDRSTEFLEYTKITDIFPINVTGIVSLPPKFGQ